MGVVIKRSNSFSAHGKELRWWGYVLCQGPVQGSRYGRWRVSIDPGKRQWLFLSVHSGRWVGLRWRANFKGKDHCKKFKWEWWFQMGDSMQRNNWSTSQHCVRYIQSRTGYLGILQFFQACLWNNSSTRSVSEKQLMDPSNVWVPKEAYVW